MKLRFAVLFGNRGFFPGEVVASARREMSEALEKAGVEPVLMDADLTHFGAVESLKEAYLFKDFLKKENPDGIVVCLPNFGDETAIAVACQDAGVPIFVQAYPDREDEMDPAHRRDAFCGKLSLMDVFCQYHIPFTIGGEHVIHPLDEDFIREMRDFAGVCRVVKGLRRCRLGAIGARVTAFKTVRYDELALQKAGISVETIDLSEVIDRIRSIDSGSSEVEERLRMIEAYTDCSKAPRASLISQAKLAIVLDRYIEEYKLDVLAIRCWNELEVQLQCAPCTVMSMLGEQRRVQVACEMDVANALMMRALSLASDGPSSVLDWNNNDGKERDTCILFHCGPVPVSMQCDKGEMVEHPMFRKSYGAGCGWGPLQSRLKPGEVTLSSAKTEDGKICCYAFDAEILDREIDRIFFGVYGVAKIANLQEKLAYFGHHCYRHHVTITDGHVASIVREACGRYLGYSWEDLP